MIYMVNEYDKLRSDIDELQRMMGVSNIIDDYVNEKNPLVKNYTTYTLLETSDGSWKSNTYGKDNDEENIFVRDVDSDGKNYVSDSSFTLLFNILPQLQYKTVTGVVVECVVSNCLVDNVMIGDGDVYGVVNDDTYGYRVGTVSSIITTASSTGNNASTDTATSSDSTDNVSMELSEELEDSGYHVSKMKSKKPQTNGIQYSFGSEAFLWDFDEEYLHSILYNEGIRVRFNMSASLNDSNSPVQVRHINLKVYYKDSLSDEQDVVYNRLEGKNLQQLIYGKEYFYYGTDKLLSSSELDEKKTLLNNGNINGWLSNPTELMSDNYIYYTFRSFSDGEWSKYNDISMYKSTSYMYEYIYQITKNETPPELNKSEGKTFSTGIAPSGWSVNSYSKPHEGEYLWMSYRMNVNGVWSEYTEPEEINWSDKSNSDYGLVSTYDLNNYVLKTELENYTSNDNLKEILNSYVTSTALTTKLKDYVLSTDLNEKLGAYVTTSNLSNELSSYVTNTNLGTELEKYTLKTDYESLKDELGKYTPLTSYNSLKDTVDGNTKDIKYNSELISTNAENIKTNSNNITLLNSKIDGISSSLSNIKLVEVVEELPSEAIKSNVLYLLVNGGTEEGNLYDVYVYVNDVWEQIDRFTLDISGKADVSTVEDLRKLVEANSGNIKSNSGLITTLTTRVGALESGKADKDTVYTKTESDSKFNLFKAEEEQHSNTQSIMNTFKNYGKSCVGYYLKDNDNIVGTVPSYYYMDSLLSGKSDTGHTHTVSDLTDISSNYYNKTEVDDKITASGVFDSTKYYTKEEVEADYVPKSELEKIGRFEIMLDTIPKGQALYVQVFNYKNERIDASSLTGRVYMTTNKTGTSEYDLRLKGNGYYYPSFLTGYTGIISVTLKYEGTDYNIPYYNKYVTRT